MTTMNPAKALARAVLALAFSCSAAHAQISCPAGQTATYTVANKQDTHMPCNVGDTFTDLNALFSACTASGTDVDGQTYTGEAYQNSPGTIYQHACSQGNCTPQDFLGTFNSACAGPMCTTPNGVDLGMVKGTGFYNPNGTVQTDANAGDQACVNNCIATAVNEITVGFSNGHSVEELDWESSGQSCTAQTDKTPQPLNNNVDCALDSTGYQGCASKGGTVGDAADLTKNGIDLGPSVVQQLANDACVSLPSGATVCTTSFSNPPDDGIAGQPATPTATIHLTGDCQSGDQCTYNYYSQTTTQSSTNYGTGSPQGQCPVGIPKLADGTCGASGSCPSGQTKGSNGVCTASTVGGNGGTTGGTGSGNCGQPGNDCYVKIDETGLPQAPAVPDLYSTNFLPQLADGDFASVQNLITKSPSDPANGGVSTSDVTSILGIPTGEGSCSPITMQLPHGFGFEQAGGSVTVMTSDGCTVFGAIRDWSGYIFGIAVVLALLSRFLNET